MKNLSRVVLLFLVAVTAVPLLAETSDFSVTIEASIDQQEPADRIAVGQSVDYLVQWRDVGPMDTSNRAIEVDVPGLVTLSTPGPLVTCDTSANPVRCTFGQFLDAQGYVWLHVQIDTPGRHTTTARAIRLDGSADANPSNDVATHTLEALALPSVRVNPSIALHALQPGEPATFSVDLQNRSAIPATNVKLVVTLPAGGTILTAQPRVGVASCDIQNNAAVCTKPSFAMNEFLQIDFSMTAPPRMDGEDLVVEMVETQAETDVDPSDNQRTFNAVMIRQIVVANVDDEGSGSLRQALHDVNALCQTTNKPCAIVFRIPAPVPANGWFTIQPRTPLPPTSGALTIDGGTQTLFTGDTNPDGPEIEINGAFVAEGSGLLLSPRCHAGVFHLAVNGFPGYGVEIRKEEDAADDSPCYTVNTTNPVTVRKNYLGTDPRGRIAKPNHRGLGIFTPEAYVFENLISGNQRSGLYVEDGAFHQIGGNRIGVGADGSQLGNGAGIFINMGSLFQHDFIGADITYNVIAYNHGMAIARTRRGEILISENSIFDNLQQGIDVGVDGPTAQRADDQDVPNAPVLFGATYDAVRNATIVRGRIDSEVYATGDSTGGSGRKIEVYASLRLSGSAEPQAEHSVAISSIPSGHQDIEIVVPGDLRGLWITATYSATHFIGLLRDDPRGMASETHRQASPGDTSELSNAVTVQ